MSDPLKPNMQLLCKLGSIAQHADEMLSSKGHHFDKAALQAVLDEDDVKAWLKQMDKLALIPKRR